MRPQGLVQIKGIVKRAIGWFLSVALAVGGTLPPLSVAAQEWTRPTVADLLAAALLSSQAVIDLSAYDLSPAALGGIYATVLQEDPALFHVAPRLSYAVTGTGNVAAVYPVYTLAGDALRAARGLYRDAIAAILSDMEDTLASPDEWEIALYLHDYVADRYDYDTRALGGNADAYTFFRDGRGVCQAYALAYLALLRAAGLEADFVSSAAMDHAWVHVRVGGEWYHVDVTRDDPIPPPGGAGMVTHTRWLCSDAALAALGYRDWVCAGGHTCADTCFDGLLSDCNAPLLPLSVGDRRVWAGLTADGVRALDRLTLTRLPLGDIDADGELTPADLLLLLHDPSVPEEWRAWMRARLVGASG